MTAVISSVPRVKPLHPFMVLFFCESWYDISWYLIHGVKLGNIYLLTDKKRYLCDSKYYLSTYVGSKNNVVHKYRWKCWDKNMLVEIQL